MKRFTDAGRLALKDGNLYAALSLALMMPDICASLEDPGQGKSQRRYVRWCKKWVEPKFTSPEDGHIFVTAEDCYQLRCSLIHSGSATIAPDKQRAISRFEFFEPAMRIHLVSVQGAVINGVPQPSFVGLQTDLFSEEMFRGAEEWDAAMIGDAAIQSEKAKLLVIRLKGTAISGIRFG
ncbi:MAG TPA: hypothetical protein VMU06_02635 [Stellaceae bacterium]|nr:hypothetical protein [Stellaceae bacterium]